MDPSTIGKEVSHPLIPKIKVKTKVESSVLQVPVGSFKGTSSVTITSSAYGSSGSLDIIPQSPLEPSGCTRSKQKTVEESVEREREREREREGQGLIPFFLFDISLLTSGLLSYCVSLLFFFTDEWSFFYFVV